MCSYSLLALFDKPQDFENLINIFTITEFSTILCSAFDNDSLTEERRAELDRMRLAVRALVKFVQALSLKPLETYIVESAEEAIVSRARVLMREMYLNMDVEAPVVQKEFDRYFYSPILSGKVLLNEWKEKNGSFLSDATVKERYGFSMPTGPRFQTDRTALRDRPGWTTKRIGGLLSS